MHLVLLHGYLLTGTGSNIYVANVARAWAAQGHAVTVVCQEPGAAPLPFVNEAFLPGDELPQEAPAEGRLRVVVPDIGAITRNLMDSIWTVPPIGVACPKSRSAATAPR